VGGFSVNREDEISRQSEAIVDDVINFKDAPVLAMLVGESFCCEKLFLRLFQSHRLEVRIGRLQQSIYFSNDARFDVSVVLRQTDQVVRLARSPAVTAEALETETKHQVGNSVLAIWHRFSHSFVRNEKFFAFFDSVDRPHVLRVTRKKEVAIGFAAVVDLAGFEEEHRAYGSHAVLLVRSRLVRKPPFPNEGGTSAKTLSIYVTIELV